MSRKHVPYTPEIHSMLCRCERDDREHIDRRESQMVRHPDRVGFDISRRWMDCWKMTARKLLRVQKELEALKGESK